MGSAVVREAVCRGWRVTVVARPGAATNRLAAVREEIGTEFFDLEDVEMLTEFFRARRFDGIVHAAFPGGHAPDAVSRRRFFLAGLETAWAVAESLRRTKFAGCLLHTGSAMVYGPSAAHDPDRRMAPVTFRGMVKACGALILEQTAVEIGFRFRDLRIYSAYGPFEQLGRFVPELMRAALRGQRISLTQTPCLRNWIFVDDVSTACLAALERREPQILNVNVGVERARTTHELAALMEKQTGRSLVKDFARSGSDPYAGHRLDVDPAHAKLHLGWSARTSLEEGLRTTWEWSGTPVGREYLLRE